jgi:hypothetical protein
MGVVCVHRGGRVSLPPASRRLVGHGQTVTLWLPLLSAGGGGLNQHFVLSTMVCPCHLSHVKSLSCRA